MACKPVILSTYVFDTDGQTDTAIKRIYSMNGLIPRTINIVTNKSNGLKCAYVECQVDPKKNTTLGTVLFEQLAVQSYIELFIDTSDEKNRKLRNIKVSKALTKAQIEAHNLKKSQATSASVKTPPTKTMVKQNVCIARTSVGVKDARSASSMTP